MEGKEIFYLIWIEVERERKKGSGFERVFYPFISNEQNLSKVERFGRKIVSLPYPFIT